VAGELTVREMHIRRIKDACAEYGIEISDQKAIEFQEAYVEEQQRISLFDEVVELLETLQHTKQLAVLTNGSHGHQAMKIKQLNLSKWIPEENIFISESLGYAKPSKEAYPKDSEIKIFSISESLGYAKPSKEAFQILENKLNLDKEKTVY